MGSPTTEANRESNETQRQVTLTNGFYMGKYQVTQAQWQAVMGNNPSNFSSNPASGEIQGNRPVESVSWYDAIEFCNKLSEQEGLTPAYTVNKTVKDQNNTNDYDTLKWTVTLNTYANGYRLPTEAQWEYACRAGTLTAWNVPVPNGSNSISTNTGWFLNNSNSMTHEVGKKAANNWGLYDMHGNVQEWCWDWYSYSSGTQTNPTGAVSGSHRVLRGGSSGIPTQFTRSAFRGNAFPSLGVGYGFGFRVIRP
jgi:formylglycine-generating enzyme required for sulfatase activity